MYCIIYCTTFCVYHFLIASWYYIYYFYTFPFLISYHNLLFFSPNPKTFLLHSSKPNPFKLNLAFFLFPCPWYHNPNHNLLLSPIAHIFPYLAQEASKCTDGFPHRPSLSLSSLSLLHYLFIYLYPHTLPESQGLHSHGRHLRTMGYKTTSLDSPLGTPPPACFLYSIFFLYFHL